MATAPAPHSGHEGFAPSPGAADIPTRPNLWPVPDLGPAAIKAFQYAKSGGETDGGDVITPDALTIEGISGAFQHILIQRAAEDSKPPKERDEDTVKTIRKLGQQSDRLLQLLYVEPRFGIKSPVPGVTPSTLGEVVMAAYDKVL